MLDVIEDDGDFDASARRRTPPEVEEAHALLERVADDVAADLAVEIRKVHGNDAASFAGQLRVRRTTPGTGPWAGFGVRTSEGDWTWIALRNLWSRAPRLRVWFYNYDDAWAKHRARAAHQAIEQRHGFERITSASWRWEYPVPALAERDPDVLHQTIRSRLSSVVRAGVFEIAVRRNR